MKRLLRKKLKLGIKVGDVMTQNFVSTKPDISVPDAIKLMVKKRIGSLILREESFLRGILTEKDIMWALSKSPDLSDVKAIDICTRKITTIKPSADIYDAIQVMRRTKFRRLPVVIKKKVIGYLTLKEILKIQPELFEIAQKGYTIKQPVVTSEEPVKEGICYECENYDLLYKKDDKLVCESCKDS